MGKTMRTWLRIACIGQLGWALVFPGSAQVKVGQLSTHLTGTVAPGYSAEYGNQTSSSHSWAIAGAGTMSGNYYNPNFLAFNAGFYLNQSRANSNFQSITNASGLDISSSIFGGSHFPGSVSYSKAYNSQGNYAVPGLPNFVTHGNSDTFGINWSENLPDVPSFSAGYQFGTSTYSVYGANNQGQNRFDSLNLHSSYRLAGFNTGAFYTNGGSRSRIPQLLGLSQELNLHTDNSAEGVNVTHALPLQGSASASFSRSNWKGSYIDSVTTGNIDLFSGMATIHPVEKLSFTVNSTYSDNLSGQLLQTVIAAGAVVPALNTSQSSNSFDIMGILGYVPLHDLQTSVFVERRAQTFLGRNYGVTSVGGSATYLRNLLNGTLNTSVSIIENSNDQNSENTLGFSTNASYSKVVLGWHTNGSFSYSQNVQTLLVSYMNSFYNYSFNARRHWGRLNVSAGGGAGRTGLTQVAGTESTSESYNAAIGYTPWISINGSYSQADGQAIATGGGLIPTPIPSPSLPSSLVSLYGGRSYSLGVSSNPVKRLIMTASYAKADSNISSAGIASFNQNNEFNALIQYQTRKLSYTSGFARLEQGFSQSNLPPGIVCSYFVGVSRWFNFF
jgi:hypothetical protein